MFNHDAMTIANFIVTMVFISFLVRSRRSPASTMAWLFFVIIAPYVGIILFLMFGQRKLTIPSINKKPLYREIPGEKIPHSESQLQRLILASGGPPISGSNSLHFLETGEEAFAKVMGMISEAKKEILISTFILGADQVGTAIMNQVAQKAREGLKVRVLVDSIGSTMFTHPSFKGLRQAGAEIAFFMPIFHIPFKGRTNLRNHRKIIITDNLKALIGGMNLAKEYMGPVIDENRWIDLSLEITGPGVLDIKDIFESDWVYTKGQTQNHAVATIQDRPVEQEDSRLQVVASGPDVPRDNLYDSLLTVIFAAKEKIWIATPYFLPDESLIKALELAARRKVDVRILIPKNSNHKVADVCRGSFIRQVQEAGAHIYMIDKMMHGKLVIVDSSCAIVGSANFDLRSLLLNYELGVFLYTSSDVIIATQWLQNLFSRSREGFHKSGFFRDIAEGIGRILSPIL